MKDESAEALKKTGLGNRKTSIKSSGCCGGSPAYNADACCKLDEDKKEQGDDGCGCTGDSKSSCC